MKSHRRGFVMVVAIVLLGLIGAALASLTEQTSSQFKRLRSQTDEAQARQILIAATHSLLCDPNKSFALPAPLLENGAALTISPITQEPTRTVFYLDVISGKIHSREILTLTQQSSRWSIADAQLQ